VSATAKLRHLPGTVALKQEAFFPVDPIKTSTLTIEGGGAPGGGGSEFAILIRVPEWATSSANRVTINGKLVAGAPYKPASYLKLEYKWKSGDTIEISFPPALWTEPLNDYHPAHNATLAFMYGPLVLAGINVESDIWVPHGGTAVAKQNPASFITRDKPTAAGGNHTLSFTARAQDGSSITLIPLKDVMAEKYAAYFMTAGTKPPQPHNGYCPHSKRDEARYQFVAPPADVDPEIASAEPPGPPPTHIIHGTSKGASWRLVDGKIVGQTRGGA